MKTVDLNGTGEWTRERVLARYEEYARVFGVAEPRVLTAREHRSEEGTWIYPILDPVIEGIVAGDRACIAIGVDLVESDEEVPFGLTLKYQTARALRRTVLDAASKQRLRERILFLLVTGRFSRYFSEYYKLLRTIGVGESWGDLMASIPRENERAMHYFNLLLANDATAPKS
jgi:hypothetical protein